MLAGIHERIHAAHPGELQGHRVGKQTWTEEDFRLEIESGTVYLEPPIEGVQAGAFFEGKASFCFNPKLEGARGNLRTAFGRPALEKVPVETAYLFALRPDSPLKAWAAAETVKAPPLKAGVYAADKSALRQLGLELTSAFLLQHPRLIRHTFRLSEESRLHRAWRRLHREDSSGHSVSIERRPLSTIWVRVEGRLAAAGAGRLAGDLRKALDRRRERVVLDLASLARIESEAADRLTEILRSYRGRIRVVLPRVGEFASLTAVFALYR
jgi:hypothetical protein